MGCWMDRLEYTVFNWRLINLKATLRLAVKANDIVWLNGARRSFDRAVVSVQYRKDENG